MADDDLITGWRAFNGGDNRDMAHSHLLRARQEDPEKAAKQAALAQRWGVGVDTARAQQETLERQAKVERDQQALTSAPKVAAWLAKTFDHAAVSHDHIPDMATVEQVVQQNTSLLTSKAADSLVARGPVLSEARGATPSVGSYLSGLGRGFAADAALAREGIRTALFDLVGDKTGSAEAQRRIGQLQWRREMSAPDFKTKLAGSVFGGVQSTLGAIPAIGAGVATRNPAVTLSIMGGQTAAPAYGKYRERGGTPGEAALGAGLEGGIEVLTEMIPMGIVVNQLGKAGVKDFLARFVGAEVPTEQAATLLQDAVDTAIANPDKTWGDFWRERPEAAFDTLVASGVMAGGLGAVHTGMRRLAKQDVEAEAAPARLKAFNEVAKATTALPLRERAPAAFEALVQELTPGVDVHVNAQAMATYLQSVGPEEADALVDSLGVREQLDAATPEQDIVIPAAKYLQHVAPTEAHKVFEQDIRLGPGAMSVREAEEHKAEREQKLAEIAGRVLLRGNEIAQVEDPVERVRQHFYEQARAVGVPEEQARANAAVQAAYYAQRAERNKSYPDAWAAYEAANISMKGQGTTTEGPRGLTAGGSTFDQDTPEFKAWFGDSKVVDETGKPQVVYHGTNAEFNVFEKRNTGNDKGEGGWLGDGFYFSTDPTVAEAYGLKTVAAYLKAEKLYDFNGQNFYKVVKEHGGPFAFSEWLRANGYDGAKAMSQVMVLDPAQIKSVDNTGSFDPNNPDIYQQGPRGQVTFSDDGALIELFKSKNVSTLVHEGAGHIWLENLARDAADPNASDEVRADLERVKDWWRANIDEAVKVSGLSKKRLLKAIDDFGGAPGMTAQQGDVVVERLLAEARSQRNPLKYTRDRRERALADVEEFTRRAAEYRAKPPYASTYTAEDYDERARLNKQYAEKLQQVINQLNKKPQKVEALGFTDLPENGTAPDVDWDAQDLQDGGTPTAASVVKEYGNGKGIAYQAYVPNDLVPDEELVEEQDDADPDGYDWTELQSRGAPPPVKIVIKPNGDAYISDGNHRTRFWREAGYDYIPAWVIDQRKGAKPPVAFEQEGAAKGGNADIEAIRPFHELFARAAERYFMEGKAPTPGLRNVFAKFRNWLVSIYKDFTKLNVPMTDDIRGVFDRMIAGDAALADAQEEQALTPALTPEAAQKLGMSEAEYAAYLETVKRADEASQDRLLGKLLSDIRRKYTDAWKAERAGLVEEYQAQVDATPEMQALTLLETGTRLQRDAVADVEARLYRRQRPYVFDDGLHPDVIADQVGLPSGQALVDALLAMKEEHDALRETGDSRTVRRARAENLADAEMVARHGDILNDGTIGDEAIAALNETRRSEVLMSEVRALVRKAGETTAVWTPAEMASWATQQIAKRKLADIRPHIFAVAEAKAGRDALKALVTDDFPAALDAKFRQLLNMYLYRAARDARETVDKGKTLFDRIATARNGTIAKSRNMDMVSAARAIIAAYGFGSSNNDADYMTKVAQYDPELWADLRDGVTAAMAGAKPVDDLTLDEFDSLHIMVDQLWRMSRTSRQMQIEFEALELEDITNDLGTQLGAAAPRPNNRAPTRTEHAMRLVSGLRAALRRVESWVEGIDGGSKGPWRTYVWQPVSEAATRFRAAKADYQRRFVELLEPIQANMRKGKIDAPELGYTFGYANSGVGKGELLHALLHTGNASNKRKLLLGRGWAVERPDGTVDTSTWDRFVDRMHAEGVVTAEDWTFIQGVWDLLEETKPDAQRAHRQVFGRYFEEVTAEPFTNRFGTFRGGYVPAIVDTFLVQEQALNLEAESITNANDATMFPSPARGFTKARVEYNKPLALDLGLLPQHIDKVLKFSHMTAPVRDVLRLLKEKSLSTKLEAFDPVAVPDLLLPWLHRSAKQMVETPSKGNAGKAADNFFRAVRTRTGMGIMIGNVINTLQQLTGWLPATLKVRKRFLTSALFRVTMDPAQVAEDIATMSPYMATRITAQAHEAQQQIEQLLLDPTKYEQVSKFAQKHAYILQSMTQNIVDTVTWQAAFEQAVVDGDDFADAVRFADSTIRQTQGSLAPEDVSRFETGSPFMRMFTQFYNYFGAQSNLLTTEFKNAPGMTRVGYVYIMGILLPAVVAESIRRAFGAGWDDEDDDGYLDMWLDVFFGSQFRYVTGMVPVAGPMLVNMANQLNQKPYDDTITPAPAFSSAAQVAGIPKDVYKLVTEGTGQKRTVRDTATLLTLLTGIPWFNAAARPLGYLADVNEGKVEPTSELDLARGLITGSASAESKQ